jgi:glycosyltransferase involved in cell wall biosynthesis
MNSNERSIINNSILFSAALNTHYRQLRQVDSNRYQYYNVPYINCNLFDEDSRTTFKGIPMAGIIFHSVGKFIDEYAYLDTMSHLFHGEGGVVGDFNVAIVFTERNYFFKEDVSRLMWFDVVFAGSTWNAEVLRKSALIQGFGSDALNVDVFLQGIDKQVWSASKSSRECAVDVENDEGGGNCRTNEWDIPEDKFVIFSGGKLELRKGQDIVLAAFKKFREKHGDVAHLVAAWANDWPKTLESLGKSGHVRGVPAWDVNEGGVMVGKWLEENGVERGSFTALPRLSQAKTSEILNDWVDVGLFTNRCEGGTNLVAMETLGSGVPVILSDNTGHRDLVERVCEGEEGVSGSGREDGCYALKDQRRVEFEGGEEGEFEGWGESQVDEVVATLEKVYRDRDAAKRVGEVGRDRIWSWGEETERMMGVVEARMKETRGFKDY